MPTKCQSGLTVELTVYGQLLSLCFVVQSPELSFQQRKEEKEGRKGGKTIKDSFSPPAMQEHPSFSTFSLAFDIVILFVLLWYILPNSSYDFNLYFPNG